MWRPVCVKAKSKEDPHYRKKKCKNEHERSNTLPKISLDHQELKSQAKKDAAEDDKVVKIMVAKDERRGYTMSYCVEPKGMQDILIAK